MDKKIPFPQADDFKKIIFLLNISSESDLSNNETISVTLGEVTDRQVMYYLSAATFLGLIEVSNGERKFTILGNRIRKMNSTLQEIELISIVLQSPIFNKVYVLRTILGEQTQEDISEIIKDYYPEYSESICERRAQTVTKWVEYISRKLINDSH
jgi:hypothetical protein